MAHRWRHKRTDTSAELARRARYNSPEHRAARKRYAVLVDAGLGVCWRCGCQLYPGAWQTGHNDAGTVIMGPECLPCQRGHASRKGARVANARRKRVRAMGSATTTLDW